MKNYIVLDIKFFPDRFGGLVFISHTRQETVLFL